MPSKALRASIITALKAASQLTTLLGGAKIYDEPPANTSFPYISVGDWVLNDWSSQIDKGHEHKITLHIWSRDGGRAEVEVIASEILQILDDMPLTLTGHTLVNMRHTTSLINREKDGRTYHAVVRFRAVTEQN